MALSSSQTLSEEFPSELAPNKREPRVISFNKENHEDAKIQVAKEYMRQTLCKGGGMVIIKHGRQGGPKSRRLQCDHAVTRIFCRSDSVYKEIIINDIVAVRRGVDIDPVNSGVGPDFAGPESSSTGTHGLASSGLMFGGKKTLLDQGTVLFGSANLRRHCKAKDMPLCLCLVTPDRTFDIQFLSKAEFDDFYSHILVLTEQNMKSDYPSNGANRFSGRSDDATIASSEEMAAAATQQQLPLKALEETYYDDEFSRAIDFEFLVSQGFSNEEIVDMCEGLREEALLRSKKAAHIRSSINLKQPADVMQELEKRGVKSNAQKTADDELSDDDEAAVNAFMEQGYTEEEALQLHLQNLFVDEGKRKTSASVAISVNQVAINVDHDTSITTSAANGSGEQQV